MATSSHAKTLLGGVDAALKRALSEVLDYVFNNSLAFGPIEANEPRTKTTNMAGRYLKVTTSGTANQEFSVAPGLGRAPNVCWPVIHPKVVNGVMLGDLTVSRAADEMRLYFASPSTGVTGFLYVE